MQSSALAGRWVVVRPRALSGKEEARRKLLPTPVWGEGRGEFTGQRVSLTQKPGSQYKDSGKFW